MEEQNTTTTAAELGIYPRDRRGRKILTHGVSGFDRGCRCQVCAACREESNRRYEERKTARRLARSASLQVKPAVQDGAETAPEAPSTATEIMRALGLPFRDRSGNIVHTHGFGGYGRGCRCDTCREGWRIRHRGWRARASATNPSPTVKSRSQATGDGAAATHSLEVLELRQKETMELHAERLRAAYEAMVARTPRGFKACSWEEFLLVQGDLSTIRQRTFLVL